VRCSRSAALGRFVNGALDKFMDEVAVGEMIQFSGSPDQNYDAALEAFAATLP